MTISRMRNFDPRAVGTLECRAWECYYRRRWAAFLVASIRLVRAGFALSWPDTLRGAWLVLRANRRWAPYPDNDPDGARRDMAAFYALVARRHGETIDVAETARREVEWWRVHREVQREATADVAALTDALTSLYAFTYRAPEVAVRPAARLRAEAMVVSDRWVAAGCDPQDPLLAHERALLVRSFATLLATVHEPPSPEPARAAPRSAHLPRP
jgi:hypothetical protein